MNVYEKEWSSIPIYSHICTGIKIGSGKPKMSSDFIYHALYLGPAKDLYPKLSIFNLKKKFLNLNTGKYITVEEFIQNADAHNVVILAEHDTVYMETLQAFVNKCNDCCYQIIGKHEKSKKSINKIFKFVKEKSEQSPDVRAKLRSEQSSDVVALPRSKKNRNRGETSTLRRSTNLFFIEYCITNSYCPYKITKVIFPFSPGSNTIGLSKYCVLIFFIGYIFCGWWGDVGWGFYLLKLIDITKSQIYLIIKFNSL
jgi:hypothetical protein